MAIVAKDGIGQEDISEITINGLKSSADVTLSKEAAPDFLTVTASGDPQPIKIGTDLSADFSDENIRFNDAIIVPQELTARTEFLKISFTDGKELTSDLYSGISFASGKQYTIEITLDKGMLSLATSVSDWVDGGIVPINNIDITSSFDPAFAKELQARGYIPDANRIYAKDVADITELDVLGTYDAVGELTSLKGIEYFTSLKHLHCNYNKLTSLDLSNNTALERLNCADNELTSLDVSNNTALIDLSCSFNQLATLDISSNTALEYLGCFHNQLTSLDVSNNTALTSLYCDYNQLTSLDVSNNTALIHLNCSFNQLATLDISSNTALTGLSCSSNKLTSLDISSNTALEYLRCFNNQLTSLDVSNNTALTSLRCSDNQLTSLDIRNNKLLVNFSCYNNPGDGTEFNVAAWFDNSNIPSSSLIFITGNWNYNGNTISINYYIPE